MPGTGSCWVPVITGALLEPGFLAPSGEMRPQEPPGQEELAGAGVSWESAFMGACHEHGAREVSWCHGGLGSGDEYSSLGLWELTGIRAAWGPQFT